MVDIGGADYYIPRNPEGSFEVIRKCLKEFWKDAYYNHPLIGPISELHIFENYGWYSKAEELGCTEEVEEHLLSIYFQENLISVVGTSSAKHQSFVEKLEVALV